MGSKRLIKLQNARKEGHGQVFVVYLNEIARNSRDGSFLSDEDQLALNHCLGTAEILVLTDFQPYFYSVLETNSSTNQRSAGH